MLTSKISNCYKLRSQKRLPESSAANHLGTSWSTLLSFETREATPQKNRVSNTDSNLKTHSSNYFKEQNKGSQPWYENSS